MKIEPWFTHPLMEGVLEKLSIAFPNCSFSNPLTPGEQGYHTFIATSAVNPVIQRGGMIPAQGQMTQIVRIHEETKEVSVVLGSQRFRVDVEEVFRLQDERRKINALKLEEIDFYEDGKKVSIDKKILDDFRFCGLSNVDFVDSGFYKDGWTEVWENVDGKLVQVKGVDITDPG